MSIKYLKLKKISKNFLNHRDFIYFFLLKSMESKLQKNFIHKKRY